MITDKNDHIKWMKAAFREAEKAFEHEEVPIGAVVVQNGHIIGIWFDQRKHQVNYFINIFICYNS